MAEAFTCIFTEEILKQILNESSHKPLAWKRYIDDIISLWYTSRDVVGKFIEQANKHHLKSLWHEHSFLTVKKALFKNPKI